MILYIASLKIYNISFTVHTRRREREEEIQLASNWLG
jgi:hypothetical protein